MNNELWLDISEYENLYQVSNCGRIKSLNYRRTGKEQILKQATNKDGYKFVSLRKNGKGKTFTVHRLVAKAFIPSIENKVEINHIDCDKTNNCVSNLEWCTHKENTDYRDLKNPKTWISNKHLTKEEVDMIKREKQAGKNYKKIWEQFSDKISLSGFEKVWYGQNWN